MDKYKIIKKTLLKISSRFNTIPENEMSLYIKRLQSLLKRMKWDDKDSSEEFLNYFKEIVDKNNYKKEEVQQILSKAKNLGLIKSSIKSNKHMERIWRSILKEYSLRGFLLEN